jgi:hypothetical protein
MAVPVFNQFDGQRVPSHVSPARPEAPQQTDSSVSDCMGHDCKLAPGLNKRNFCIRKKKHTASEQM